MRFKDPNSDAQIFALLNKNLDKYQAQLFFFSFSLRYLETIQKMVWTLDSSDKLKVVHHPDFTLLQKNLDKNSSNLFLQIAPSPNYQ